MNYRDYLKEVLDDYGHEDESELEAKDVYQSLDQNKRLSYQDVAEQDWDNPEIIWIQHEQSGVVKKAEPKQEARWGSSVIAVFPNGSWVTYSENYDSSG